MKNLAVLLLVLFSCFAMAQTEEEPIISEETLKEYERVLDSIEQTLSYQRGTINLDNGLATLNVPDGYKFLDGPQSKRVIEDIWGNPPGSSPLGLLLPENTSPVSDNFTYAVEIEYIEDGYIEDEDAEDLDYDELLEEMQKEAEASNEERLKLGYSSIELVGWAAEPFYDAENKKLHWAKELNFDSSELNTLNYNIRVLGRKGYLNLNAIGDIDVLPQFQKDVNGILTSVNFNDGYKYSDFDASIDEVAAYGIGGLIVGKVLAKAGFFALLLKFWKFIAIGIVAAFAGVRKFIFNSRKEEETT